MSRRPGLPTTVPLNYVPTTIQPILDLIARITGQASNMPGVRKIVQLNELVVLPTTLGGGAVLADVIAKINDEVIPFLAEQRENDRVLRAKIDEIISRLQED